MINPLHKSCAIMQPTYLPWSGYFNLIALSDIFYYLDDVQFEKGTWQQRNRILMNGQPLFLTVPTIRQHLGQPLKDILICDDNSSWRKKHLSTLNLAYKKKPYFDTLQDIFSIISNRRYKYLVDLNISIIECICNMLSLHSNRLQSSSKAFDSVRSAKILDLCIAEDCNSYISPIGAAQYLEQDSFVTNGRVALLFQDYEPSSYIQGRNSEFISHMSILDVLVNIGIDRTKSYIL